MTQTQDQKPEIDQPDRLLRIAEAARAFVKLVDQPHDGPGYEFRREQQRAYARLIAVVTEEEAIDATDS
jgi:hypothetical protein